ncbi:MAG: dethiobiotin synthetase [uncultured bacterium]|nr:MAG: dethiobiotin synthetase [uncultured bacterium]
MRHYFVTGTDTHVGKTVVSAMLLQLLQGCYWKPIQAGLPGDLTDVQTLTGLPDKHFFSSTYNLNAPLSPHQAALLEDIQIDLQSCRVPVCENALIVEGAGGVFVPINDMACMLDLMKQLNFPVIIVARGTLGTINHTLLTIEALRHRQIPIHGVVFNGDLNPANQKTIEEWGNVRTLFHVPQFATMNKSVLHAWIRVEHPIILERLA